MKKSLKKLTVLLMAVAMVITSMSFTAFAATSANDKKDITVSGVEQIKEGDPEVHKVKVYAYKIVQANYEGNEFTGYSAVTGVNIADKTTWKPTATEIATIVANKASLTKYELQPQNDGTYKANVPVGEYIVLVEGSNVNVYNPMIVSVAYDANSNAQDGSVAASGTLYGEEGAYAKKSEPDVTKKIIPLENQTIKGPKGDDVHINDEVGFQIDTTIPSYSGAFTNPKFIVEDKLTVGGLNGIYDIVVKAGDNTLAEGDDKDYVIKGTGEGAASRDFKVEFTKAYITAHGNQPIVITYKSKLTTLDNVNFDPNDNEARITYSNNPNEEKSSDWEKTHHYTFEINGQITGKEGFNEKRRKEVIKVDEKGTRIVLSETIEKSETKYGEATPLEGAQFKLYYDEAGTKPVKGIDGNDLVATTDASGRLIGFKGLDAGTYYIKETKAPTGYALDSTAVKAVISAEYNEDGTLKNYSVAIGNGDAVATSTYTATYENGVIKTVDHGTEGNQSYEIINKKIGTLPSTGGMGTIIFTIAGIAIMAIAAGLFIANRKNASK